MRKRVLVSFFINGPSGKDMIENADNLTLKQDKVLIMWKKFKKGSV
jgi:hypothetical protein